MACWPLQEKLSATVPPWANWIFPIWSFHFLGPDAALILGHWHLKREKDDLGGVFSLVWQRFPEGWRIIHDHTSADIKQTSSE